MAIADPDLIALSGLELFEGVALEGLPSDAWSRHEYRRGDVVFRSGDPGPEVFVILGGEVSIETADTLVRHRRQGALIGEQALLHGGRRTATVRATEPTTLLRISGPQWARFFDGLRFTQNLARSLSRKLGDATDDRGVRYRREEVLFSEFRAHASPQVLDQLLGSDADAYQRPRKATVTVLLADIRGFSTTSAGMEPTRLAADLGAYFAAMVAIIHRHGGMVDKFIGDAIMAFWGGFPTSPVDTDRAAISCAQEMLAEAPRRALDGTPVEIGIGVNTGEVFIGNVGTDLKRQFTVLGGAVNLAARLESETKEVGAPLVIGSRVYEGLDQTTRAAFQAHHRVLRGVGATTYYAYQKGKSA